jgi:hypothetical protein
MQIDPNLSVGALARTASQPPAAAPKAKIEHDHATFGQSDALQQALKDTPAVRGDKVEQAIVLIGQVDYPPPQVIRRISSLLAMNLQAD